MQTQVGIATRVERLGSDISQRKMEAVVRRLCGEEHVDGLLVQLPLPGHLNEEAVIDSFDPSKDVDGFHPVNVGYSHHPLPPLQLPAPYIFRHTCEELYLW